MSHKIHPIQLQPNKRINLVRFSTSDFDILGVWLGQIRDSQIQAVMELLVKLKLDSVSFKIWSELAALGSVFSSRRVWWTFKSSRCFLQFHIKEEGRGRGQRDFSRIGNVYRPRLAFLLSSLWPKTKMPSCDNSELTNSLDIHPVVSIIT